VYIAHNSLLKDPRSMILLKLYHQLHAAALGTVLSLLGLQHLVNNNCFKA
jgi:hypothetical protein